MTLPPSFLPRSGGNVFLPNIFVTSTGYLVGKPARRTLQIAQETNTKIYVNDTMTISVSAGDGHSAARDLNDACERIQHLLLQWINPICDEGAKGRLVYELVSSSGLNCPPDSSSFAVRARDPYFGDGSFFTLVKLPFEYHKGRRVFHGDFILRGGFLSQIRRLNCLAKLCGNEFGVPLLSCDPYVLVSGKRLRDVDEAAEIMRSYILDHMDKCQCAFD